MDAPPVDHQDQPSSPSSDPVFDPLIFGILSTIIILLLAALITFPMCLYHRRRLFIKTQARKKRKADIEACYRLNVLAARQKANDEERERKKEEERQQIRESIQNLTAMIDRANDMNKDADDGTFIVGEDSDEESNISIARRLPLTRPASRPRRTETRSRETRSRSSTGTDSALAAPDSSPEGSPHRIQYVTTQSKKPEIVSGPSDIRSVTDSLGSATSSSSSTRSRRSRTASPELTFSPSALPPIDEVSMSDPEPSRSESILSEPRFLSAPYTSRRQTVDLPRQTYDPKRGRSLTSPAGMKRNLD